MSIFFFSVFFIIANNFEICNSMFLKIFFDKFSASVFKNTFSCMNLNYYFVWKQVLKRVDEVVHHLYITFLVHQINRISANIRHQYVLLILRTTRLKKSKILNKTPRKIFYPCGEIIKHVKKSPTTAILRNVPKIVQRSCKKYFKAFSTVSPKV